MNQHKRELKRKGNVLCEDSTRIGVSGTARGQVDDVSPLRVNQALSLIIESARKAAFRSSCTTSECPADELAAAARNVQESYAVKKKDKLERIVKSNR